MRRAFQILVLIALVNPWREMLGADTPGASPNSRPPVLPRTPVSAQASRKSVAPPPPIYRPSGSPAHPPSAVAHPRAAASPTPAYSGADRSSWSENAAKARRDAGAEQPQLAAQLSSTNALKRRTQPGAVPAKADGAVRGTEVNLQRLVRYFGKPSPVSTNTNAAPAFNPPMKETGPLKPSPGASEVKAGAR